MLARRSFTPNVAIPQGDLFPNGVDINPANPDVQATVRPMGWLFRPSAGFPSIRPGVHKLDLAHPQGFGIHFTPTRFAEDIRIGGETSGPPPLVDVSKASMTADVADLPGSEFLDDEGKVPGALARENRGTYLGESAAAPGATGDMPRHGGNTLRDMGDRSPLRPLTRTFYGLTRNPAGVLKQEYADNPVIAVAWGAAILGIGYMLATNIENAFRSRRGRGVAATAGAAPAAAAAGTGAAVSDTATAANKSLTAAGDAVQTAVSAAGDAVEAAGEAVEKASDAAADAVKSD